jgi:hypothetical protein
MENRFVPLPHEWMLVAIIGFFITIFEVWRWSKTWGFAFVCLFIIIFIASLLSMNAAGTSEEEMIELAIHHPKVRRGEHRRKP